MGDWIKLPSGAFSNLDHVTAAWVDEAGQLWISEGPLVEAVRKENRAALLAAFESRCRKEDGGLRD